ncbi:unnamed protein product [Periconia digitata]|uniref:Secreted protein n=1 Tax=Periconia digitata TaxID=1303443 RepID=A0A9W4XE31_9PLEO|nr:unnamed protein product [Periconia digitata]
MITGGCIECALCCCSAGVAVAVLRFCVADCCRVRQYVATTFPLSSIMSSPCIYSKHFPSFLIL